jgi:hypothetical protein
MSRQKILPTAPHLSRKPPQIIAKAYGTSVEQCAAEFGALFTVTDRDGETRYRSNKRENALAWLEGYAAGRKDARQIESG